MTENPSAAVPSEPTTPALKPELEKLAKWWVGDPETVAERRVDATWANRAENGCPDCYGDSGPYAVYCDKHLYCDGDDSASELAAAYLAALAEIERLRARVEVGPSPEQIEAGAHAFFEAFYPGGKRWEEVSEDRQISSRNIAHAVLVAACSVRGR